jgi:hypothetical protein
LPDRIPTTRDRHPYRRGDRERAEFESRDIALQGIGTVPPNRGAIVAPSSVGNDHLTLEFNYARTRGAIVFAAAGNYGCNTGSQLMSRHTVVPVASCEEPDADASSNVAASIGRLDPLRYQSQLQRRE